MKRFLLLLIPFLLMSCVWAPADNTYSVREKTSYTSFSDDADIFILPTPIRQKFVPASFPGKRTTSRQIGSVYSIYDARTDTVLDYVFSPSKEYYKTNLQKITDSKGNVFYLDADTLDGCIYLLSPEKTEIEKILMDDCVRTYSVDSGRDLNRFKLIYKEVYRDTPYRCTATLQFFDADTKTFGKEFTIQNAVNQGIRISNYVPVEKGGDGWIWFFTVDRNDWPKRSTLYLNRVNPATETLEEKVASFDGVVGDQVYEWTDACSWNHKVEYDVLDSNGDQLLVRIGHSIISEEDQIEFALIDKNTFTTRTISSNLERYVGNTCGKFWFYSKDNNLVSVDENSLEVTSTTPTEIKFNGSTLIIRENKIYILDKIYEKPYKTLLYALDGNTGDLIYTKQIPDFEVETMN